MLIKKTGRESSEYYCKYSEFKAMKLDGIADCSIAYIKNWRELTSEEQAELKSNIFMFDVEEMRWIPQ